MSEHQSAWHAPADVLSRFAVEPNALDDSVASSVEAHLVACSECRQVVADSLGAIASDALSRSWASVADRIDRPRPSVVERLLDRLGLRADVARVVASTPALRLAWLSAVALIGVVAVAMSRSEDAIGPFLVIAPLAPLVAVAVAFAPAADPAGEAGVATALHGPGLALRRAAIALASTFIVLALAALALPHFGPSAAAWILPALAVSIGTLALATMLRIELAAAAAAFGWLTVVLAVWIADSGVPLAHTGVFGEPGQLGAAVLGAASAVVLARRCESFATLEVWQ